MYQSPVNAVAELIANAWDADATEVDVRLPTTAESAGVLELEDDGVGMTHKECQDFFLEIGRNRRGDDPTQYTDGRGRPVLGRKGIGKFAGFGIARFMEIETVSAASGELTRFRLDLEALTGEDYVGGKKKIDVLEYKDPDDERVSDHGTRLTLSGLTISRIPSPDAFRVSMARRFLLHQGQEEFEITVDGEPLPAALEAAGFEYVFPRDMPEEFLTENKIDLGEDGWGEEDVSGKRIRWRFLFHKDTLDEEELKGVAVFTRGKLAQRPFFFLVTKGLHGQHGTEYMAGQVVADYIDELPNDLIATERQRINWEHTETRPLLEWGRERLRQCLRLWASLRAERKAKQLEEKLTGFEDRLGRLKDHEQKTVRRALKAIGRVSTLSDLQFEELAEAVLTAWEQGRLHDLIHDMSESPELSEEGLLDILVEAKVLTALQTVEVVRTKLETVRGLRRRIEARELENAVRDFIAENPWLISPEWETFTRERGLKTVIREAAENASLTADVYRGRVDLTMASGQHLLVLEFVRPGSSVDWDHLSRFELYVTTIRARVSTQSGGPFRIVTGYLIADGLTTEPEFIRKVESLEKDGMLALEWGTLLDRAEAGWRDFMDIIEDRGEGDFRMKDHFESVRVRESA